MRHRFLFAYFKIALFLIIWFFTQTVSAQHKPVALEGYWHTTDCQLYLQNGFFLLQTKDQAAFSGSYQLEGTYLKLGQGQHRQVFKFVIKDDILMLQGAEAKIELRADKHCASRNVFFGTISRIEKEKEQNGASSQLPDQYYN